MKLSLLLIFTTLALSGFCQSTDSSWFEKKYIQPFVTDAGTYLPNVSLLDTKGKKVTLSDYNGKILYIGIWATSCGSSITKFPYQQQLLKRLKSIGIDSFFHVLNIHIDDTKKEWFKSLKKYQPIGINLYCNDTSLLTKWNISAPPTYLLVDGSGKVLAKDISQPDEAGVIDYILFSLSQKVNITDALWTMHKQQNLMAKHKTSSVISDKYYKNWFDLTIQSFLAFQKWRTEHTMKNRR